MKILTTAQARQKISKLKRDLQELKASESRFAINITRLRTIKGLCEDEMDLRQFAYFIAEKSLPKVMDNPSLTNETKKAATQSLERMYACLEAPEELDLNELRQLYFQLKGLQNQTHHIHWNTAVRTIRFWDVYLLEASLQCFITKNNPNLGYELARDYCQKYNSSHGPGLIPESIPFLEEVVGFWEKWLACQ